jgi:glyoxylase-like metal-dependent hydrolase (beta-lactamase superfamily II)
MREKFLVAASVTLSSVLLTPVPVDRPAPTRVQIADGVYLFKTAPYGPVGLDGNSIAIISNDGVLVFDSNGTPSASRAVLNEIRSITSQPVKYVVNSHWHWDHWYGTEVYKAAFPAVQIIAHEKTRAMMMGPAIEFNKPGIESQLPGFIKDLEQRIAAAERAAAPPANLPRLKQTLEEARFFLDQKKNVSFTFPNVTFTNQLTLFMGEREIQVRHHDRAVTPGDAFLYLPKEKILITGDLLINPISFALSVYPNVVAEDARASRGARRIDHRARPRRPDARQDAAARDDGRLSTLLAQGKALKAKGVDVDTARDQLMPSLAGPMATLTGGNAALNDAFKVQLVDWYLHRVYEELDGPLTDAIAAIPQK